MIGDPGFAAHVAASGLPSRTRIGCLMFIVLMIMSGCTWVSAGVGYWAARHGPNHHHQHSEAR